MLAWAFEPEQYRRQGSYRWLSLVVFTVFVLLEIINAEVARSVSNAQFLCPDW